MKGYMGRSGELGCPQVFAEFDYDESGTIEHNELYAAMEYMGIQVSRKVSGDAQLTVAGSSSQEDKRIHAICCWSEGLSVQVFWGISVFSLLQTSFGRESWWETKISSAFFFMEKNRQYICI